MSNIKKLYIVVSLIIIFGIFIPKQTKYIPLEIKENKPELNTSFKQTFNFTTPEMEIILNNQKQIYIAKQEQIKAEQRRIEEEKRLEELKRQEEIKREEQRKIEIARTNTVTSRGTDSSRGEWLEFSATSYCACSKCCGKATGRTASGTIATQGRTIAMPSNYSFGTKIEIQGMGVYVVEDRGGAIKSNKVDIFFNSHSEALKFGRKKVYLRVVN